ncbi:hypothetical protein [Anaerospora hongkongensis]|uniref:hypothetical protein n=1 Tax=Anaerospora hongkongensis TaxID=244830 RepID=UPI001404E721|nr:hypothetical protein [Anaerospora hongkongensis]
MNRQQQAGQKVRMPTQTAAQQVSEIEECQLMRGKADSRKMLFCCTLSNEFRVIMT